MAAGERESEMSENGKPVGVTDANFGTEIEKAEGLAIVDF